MRSQAFRTAIAIGLLALTAAYVCSGLLRDPSSLGVHDWDAMEAYRQLVVDSVRRFGQVPFWDPHACGGCPAWAAPEAATIVVSPMLPVYLLLPLATALRIEIVSTLALALAGTWLLASRFLKDPIVIAMVSVVGVMSSRWALQAASGHTWHLYYAWFPWTLWAYLSARDAKTPSARWRWLAATSLVIAMMVYTGAIYPLPHALLAMATLAAYSAVRGRSWRPIALVAIAGAGGIALAMPKLLPMMDVMARFPRLVSSREYMWPHEYLATFVASGVKRGTEPVPGLDWGYQEYGIFLGVLGVAAIVVGTWRAPRDPDVRALRFAGLFFMWLSLGLFGPWVLLHLVPPFKAQHVPTRFAYPGVAMLAIVAGASLEAALPRLRARLRTHLAKRLDAALVLAFVALAFPIARESAACLAEGFGSHPAAIARKDVFAQTFDPPPELAYPGANGPATLTVHEANAGTIQCSTFHGFNYLVWKELGGRPPRQGARGMDEPDYRGEAFVESGAGTATIARFSPNEIVVDVRGATPGDFVVLNQNWDESWRANGAPTVSRNAVNAYRATASDERVVFRYVPRTFSAGLAIAAVAALLFGAAIARAARVARTSSAKSAA